MNGEPAAVAERLACIRCGYDLRGLDQNGQCPECGLGIARSLSLGRELQDSRPGWIRGLAAAARLLLAVQLSPIAGIVALAYYDGRHLEDWVLFAGAALVAAVHLAGVWLLTRPENPHAAVQPMALLRRTVRLCALGPLVAGIGAAVLASQANWMALRWVALPALTAIACPVLEFMILHRLAVRVLDKRLAEHSAIVACGYSGMLLVISAEVALDVVVPSQVADGNTTVLAVELALLLLFWMWSMLLLAVHAGALGRAAMDAQRAWRQADAAEGRQA